MKYAHYYARYSPWRVHSTSFRSGVYTLSTFRRTSSVTLTAKLPSVRTKVKMDPTPSSNRSPPSSAKDSKRGKRRRRDDVDKLGEAAGRGNKDGDSYSTLGKLVSKATKPTRETGYKHLDDDTVRRIKAIAKQDDNCSDGAIRYLMQRMAAKSAEVRYMALCIVGILFQRSRVVRAVVVADLKSFMNLAVGHDARQPLPGPPAAAAALRQKALGLLEEWNEAHGDVHKGLRAAYRFLREGKRMKFPEVQVRAVREREELSARREKHAQRLLLAKYFQAKGEIQDQAPDIDTMVREMRECFDILLPVVPGTDAIALAGNAIDLPNTGSAASAPSLSVHAAPLGEEAAGDSALKQGVEERVRQAEVAGGEEDSDDAEGMEWEEGGEQGDDNSDAGSGQEEETGERTVSAKLRRVDGIEGTLRTVADTVEAAGLGTSGYELQIEVPLGLSLTTGSSDGDTALVTSALRERYKVLTRRLLPLLSEWIQTLSRVHFDDQDTNPNSIDSNNTIGTGPGNRGTEGPREDMEGDTVEGGHHNAFTERRSCAFLLSRCLATRAAANTVVSKYLELKIDEDGSGGARRATAEGTTSGVSGGNYRSDSDARGLRKDKSRLQIRIDKRKEGQR